MEVGFKEICSQLKGLKEVLISTHIYPDPDAIGSACGMALGLASLGIKTRVFLDEPAPKKLAFLAAGVELVHEVPKGRIPALLVVDTASKKRVGERADALLNLSDKSFNIDHHFSNDRWAAVNYIDAESAASAQIVFQLLKELGAKITPEIATVLFAGLMDDTGSFRYSNTTASAFNTAAEMLQCGARPQDVANNLYFSTPSQVLKLRAHALGSLKSLFGGKIMLLVVTDKLLAECGASAEETDGLIDEARSVEGALGAVMIREIPGGWKISLRSKSENFDVNGVAAEFGGGGHKAAAGYKSSGTIEFIEAQLIAALGRYAGAVLL